MFVFIYNFLLEKLNCHHLFFCFKWLLVIFKREFDFYDCMRIWETLWSQKKSDYYQLFIAVAILKQNKAQLFELNEFDTILKVKFYNIKIYIYIYS